MSRLNQIHVRRPSKLACCLSALTPVFMLGCASAARPAPLDAGPSAQDAAPPEPQADATAADGSVVDKGDTSVSDGGRDGQAAAWDGATDLSATADGPAWTGGDAWVNGPETNGCTGGGARVFLTLSGAGPLALDERSLYVGTADALFAIPKAGGAVLRVTEGDAGAGAVTLAADASHIYFTTSSSVRRAPKTGGAVETLFSGLSMADELALSADMVYVADLGGPPSFHGRLLKVPKVGGAAGILVSDVHAAGVAVDGNELFYLVSDGGTKRHGIYRSTIEGGEGALIYPDGIAGHRLLASATHLFALVYSQVARIDRATNAAVTFPGRGVGGHSMAIDDRAVYWTIEGYWGGVPDPNEAGSVLKAALAGGAVTHVANCLVKPGAIAVDEEFVYWVHGLTGEIVRAPKN
jgi:hypothetical protein